MNNNNQPKQYTFLASGAGALLVWIIFALAVPLIAAGLVSLAIFFPYDNLMASDYPLGMLMLVAIPVSWLVAGLTSAIIGAGVAVGVHRQGKIALWYVIALTIVVFPALAVIQWLAGVDFPGAVSASLTTQSLSRWLLVFAASIIASAVCWWITIPLQRRSI